MKKGMKFSLCILGSGIGLAILAFVLVTILQHFGLMFRAWVGATFFVIMVLLGFSLSGGIVYTLAKLYSSAEEISKEVIDRKIATAIGMIVVLLGTGAFGILTFFGWIFAYEQEHVVEKYAQKMVAYVDSFLDVTVTYHEYINVFVCGYPELGWEWYGNGGYDPFEREVCPAPISYVFYDVHGNVVVKSEEEQSANQDVTDKEQVISVFPPEKMECRFRNTDTKEFSQMSYSVDSEKWKEINTRYHYQFFFEDTGYLIFSYDWLNLQQLEGAVIYTSVDGGKFWSLVSDTPSDEWLQNTVFFDKNIGIFEYGTAGTDSYLLYVTTDGANTFEKVELPEKIQGDVQKMKAYLSK